MRFFSRFALVLTALACVFCAKEKESSKRIPVVVTIPPLADLVKSVGGDRVEVTTLLPPGASPHTFEPTPSQARFASGALLAVRVGLELDHWVDGLLPEKVTTVTAGALGEIELIEDSQHGHKGANPHIWLDPVYAGFIAGAIADSLIKLDPGNRALYESNRDSFFSRLDTLNTRISDAVFGFHIKGYVEFHPAWSYFGRRYGLEELAVIEESAGKEPSPKHLAEVVKVVRTSGARAVFAEPQFSSKAVEAIAREAGVRVFVLDPLGNPGESYLDLMYRNLDVLKEALGTR